MTTACIPETNTTYLKCSNTGGPLGGILKTVNRLTAEHVQCEMSTNRFTVQRLEFDTFENKLPADPNFPIKRPYPLPSRGNPPPSLSSWMHPLPQSRIIETTPEPEASPTQAMARQGTQESSVRVFSLVRGALACKLSKRMQARSGRMSLQCNFRRFVRT